MLSPEKAHSAVNEYFAALIEKFHTGQAREHAYRPALERLMHELDQSLTILNDPARGEHGNPDFIFLRGDVMAGHGETKDIGVPLDKVESSEQLSRYFGYANLFLTDYLEFRFYKNGERTGDPIIIGAIENNHLVARPEKFSELANALSDFTFGTPQPIKSGKRLAQIMGGKARRIRDNIRQYLATDSEKNAELMRIYEVIKKLLVHDLSIEKFADMYAQTLVYGLFVARYNDDSLGGFSRQEARELVPESNPFLREFFDHIAGPRFDKRLGFIVDEMCAVFSVSDLKEIVHKHLHVVEESGNEKDPIIHFYEDFLQEYDPAERKKMGAYYTPLPVVRFIVRMVDEVLKRDFGLVKGLADTSKRQIAVQTQGMKPTKVDIHRVQILDPAVGTATFLNEIIKFVSKDFIGQEGRWCSYVERDLIPRLHGFELMMAPYTIAHLKLAMTLQEAGCGHLKDRLGVYLTNALEEGIDVDGTLFSLGLSDAIAREAEAAGRIKREKPIMVVLGNPPYSVSSSNQGDWIQNLIKDYKRGLGEKKINLDDDYIKFIRFAEHFIERNGSGVVAMITNNSFIDGITHRQMRKHLLETFDDIYVLDLHGNSKKKEKAPDGGKDENVFNIQQGVAISIFVRKEGKKEGLGSVHHAELYGTRKNKFETLEKEDIEWRRLEYTDPSYFFVPKVFTHAGEYEQGIGIVDLFPIWNSGVKTDRDALFIDKDKQKLSERMQTLLSGEYDERFRSEFRVVNSGSYKITEKLRGKHYNSSHIQSVQYRPFDYQWIYYDPTLISRPAEKVLSHIVGKENVALVSARQFGGGEHFICFCTQVATEISSQPFAPYTLFPLYLYAADGSRVPNLRKEIIESLEKIVGEITPEDVFDYIYSMLHSPNYREKYKEFLKIDFPRVPYPKSADQFRALVTLGRELRSLHLLESPKVQQFITTYPESGSNVIDKIVYKDDRVYINAQQYFGGVPEIAWNFYIGGYQPAQKWLKDRKGRVLSNEENEHYQKIIIALTETKEIMDRIDSVLYGSRDVGK